jgi:hypothetical protein
MEVALTTAASCPQGADKKFTPRGYMDRRGASRARTRGSKISRTNFSVR